LAGAMCISSVLGLVLGCGQAFLRRLSELGIQ
jgi:hypothetical protein